MTYKKVEIDGRVNSTLEGYTTYRKNIEAPIEIKKRAKELGLCVQDYISKLIIEDLRDGRNKKTR